MLGPSRDQCMRLLNLSHCCTSPSQGTYSIRHPSAGFSFFTPLSKTCFSGLLLLLNFLQSSALRHWVLLFPPARELNLVDAQLGCFIGTPA